MKNLIIGIVIDFSYPKSVIQSLPLLTSIRKFGGKDKDSDIMVCHVGCMPKSYKRKLANFKNIIIKEVPLFNKKHKPSNKLRFFQQPELNNYEYCCLLDCDTVMLNSISNFFVKDKFLAKMADGPTVTHRQFKRVFKAYGAPLPKQTHKTTKGTPSLIYCNAGVLVFHNKYVKNGFLKHWIKINKWLCDNLQLLGKGRKQFFCEQASLSLAFYTFHDISYQELPLGLNLPGLHYRKWLLEEKNGRNVSIIHYHHQINNKGFLKIKAVNNKIKRKIDALNRAV